MAVCWRKCQDGFEALSVKEGDSGLDRFRKRLFGPVALIVSITVLVSYTATIPVLGAFSYVERFSSLFLIAASAACVAALCFSRIPTAASLSLCVTAGSIAALCTDWTWASFLRPRTWGGVVVALDVCLVFSLGDWLPYVLIVFTMLYLAVERAEAVLRFGFYEAANLEANTARIYVCDCSTPPCGVDWSGAALNWVWIVFVCVTDFVLTRGFAKGLRQQMALVDASIEAAGRVAEALARFDLEAAGSVLTEAGQTLPGGLSDSLGQLLSNLASYRPYLPHSCLEVSLGATEAAEESNPATPKSRSTGKISSSRDESVGGLSPSLGSSGWQSVSAADRRKISVMSASYASAGSRAAENAAAESRGSTSSSITGSPGAGGEQLTSPGGGREPQLRRVTLLARNSCGLLQSLPLQDPQQVAEWLAGEVERFQSTVIALGGVPDLFCGDHFSASFGALRVQGTQRSMATRAAVALTSPSAAESGALGALQVTTVVCCGKALCGDFGSATAQRFMVIGGVSAFLPCLERAAAAWGVGTLIDAAVQSDAEQSWCCRLRMRALFPKLTPRPIGIWEVVCARSPPTQEGEWMYQLQSTAASPWAPYNELIIRWCDNPDGSEAWLSATAAVIPQAREAAVACALRGLSEQLRDGAPPPQHPLAVIADPAPLAPRDADAGSHPVE